MHIKIQKSGELTKNTGPGPVINRGRETLNAEVSNISPPQAPRAAPGTTMQ